MNPFDVSAKHCRHPSPPINFSTQDESENPLTDTFSLPNPNLLN